MASPSIPISLNTTGWATLHFGLLDFNRTPIFRLSDPKLDSMDEIVVSRTSAAIKEDSGKSLPLAPLARKGKHKLICRGEEGSIEHFITLLGIIKNLNP